MRCRASTIAVAVLAGLAVLCSAAIAAPPPTFKTPKRFYLSLGDSLAFGEQRAKLFQEIDSNTFDPATFNTGFTDVLTAKLRTLRPGITTVNYGCPSEGSESFIEGGCSFHDGTLALHDEFPLSISQLDAALAFLRAHPAQVSPITISLGAVDVLVELFAGSCNGDIGCFGAQLPDVLDEVRENLDVALARLRQAAPRARIIVLQYYDPFAVGGDPRFDATIQALNATIADAAGAHGALVADAFTPFNRTGDEADTLCRLTLYCTPEQDIHASDAGYAVIADAFWTASGYGQLAGNRASEGDRD